MEKAPLNLWLRINGSSVKEMAEALNVSVQFLYRVANGRSRPSLEIAVAIEDYTKGAYPARHWIDHPKKKETTDV